MQKQDDTTGATTRRTLLLALGTAGVAGLAGCGGDGGDGTDTATGTEATEAAETTAGTDTSTGTDTPTDTRSGTDSSTPTRTDTPINEDLGDPPDTLLSFSGSTVTTPDTTATIEGTLSNPYLFDVHAVELSVSTPEGWSVSPTDPQTFDSIDTGGDRSVTWDLTVPEDAEGQSTVAIDVSYESATDSASVTLEQSVTVFTGDVPVEGLLAHYPLDGDTPTDASGNGNDATINGDPDTGISGAVNGAYALDGDFLELPAFTPSDDSVSVSMWLNIDSLETAAEFFFWGDDPTQFELLHLAGSLQFFYWDGSGKIGIGGTGETLPTGEWVHVAGTYDDSTGEWALYVDGTEIATANDPIGSTGVDDVSFSGNASRVGVHPGVGRQMAGSIDEVRVYDRALSTQEVLTLSEQGSGS
jgi:hypothetical protein